MDGRGFLIGFPILATPLNACINHWHESQVHNPFRRMSASPTVGSQAADRALLNRFAILKPDKGLLPPGPDTLDWHGSGGRLYPEAGETDHKHPSVHLEWFPLDEAQIPKLAPADIDQSRLGQDK